MRVIRLLISVCLVLLPTVSQAWWSDDWQYRKSISLDTTAGTGIDVKGNTADVPVLIRLHAGNFGYFLDVKPDAGDIRFISADDKTLLKHHVEKFDPINEIALIWVKVPKISGGLGSNSLWMYYGNLTAKTGDDMPGTYDINQSLLLHFNEKDNIPKDASSFQNNPIMSTVEYFNSSIIGGGAKFRGNSIVKAPVSPALVIDPSRGWTFSSWLKISSKQSNAYVLHQTDGTGYFSVVIDGEAIFVSGKSGSAKFETPKTDLLTVGKWHNITVIVGDGRISLYVDGLEQSSTPALFSPISDAPIFGAQANGANYFVGELDEISISNIARSSDYVAMLAKGQAAQSTMIKYGGDEQADASSEGEVSYFAEILKNVTVDGWVVIIILCIMAMISWIVMFSKSIVIGRAKKENNAFLRFYKARLQDDSEPTVIDGQFDNSPLYVMYAAGMKEVNSRVGKSVGAQANGLSLQATNSIRAMLDASLLRENQRLSRNMVLLTIAISGGPFLGLLGTVVGVMITFAAIAAAGEVNVNAIAPGIAAALVATVAGLAVAIPALFAYNYFGSVLKDISNDMHVFIDEFVTNVAEEFGQG